MDPGGLARYIDLTGANLRLADRILEVEFGREGLHDRVRERIAPLLGQRLMQGALLEVPVASGGAVIAGATWAFVGPSLLDRLLETSSDRLDARILDEMLVAEQLLAPGALAHANATRGVDLFLLYFKADDGLLSPQEQGHVVQEMMRLIFPSLCGYNLRSFTGRVRHRAQALAGVQAGVRLAQPLPAGGGGRLATPVLMHASRDSVQRTAWIGRAFVWRPPQLGLTPAEQELLDRAARGMTDDAIAAACGVSLSSIKKRWQSALERVGDIAPHVLGGASNPEGRRGPEKRTRLIRYVAERPEELRPYKAPPGVDTGSSASA
jgi:DNA-binding CsgD family transcriptional regulator